VFDDLSKAQRGRFFCLWQAVKNSISITCLSCNVTFVLVTTFMLQVKMLLWTGVSGKMTTEGADEDDNFGTESSHQAILEALGVDRRNRVLARLYMGRSDTAPLVRQAALHVWKVVVSHTPRTLRDMLPILLDLLLKCLASRSSDKRQVAARTLGDVVKKLGEKVLPEIIPILEHKLDSDESEQRQGVCIGLSEIMGSTSRDHVSVLVFRLKNVLLSNLLWIKCILISGLEWLINEIYLKCVHQVAAYADSLIPCVCRALCDRLPEVREYAARTFDILHSNIGPRTLDDILPVLLGKLVST
jgi:hypothetical protein